MNILKFVFAVFSVSLICTPAYTEEVTQFKDIMSLMEGANVTYERIGKYERPFKVTKKGDRWIFKQMKNFKKSPIKDAGIGQLTELGPSKRLAVSAALTITVEEWLCAGIAAVRIREGS